MPSVGVQNLHVNSYCGKTVENYYMLRQSHAIFTAGGERCDKPALSAKLRLARRRERRVSPAREPPRQGKARMER